MKNPTKTVLVRLVTSAGMLLACFIASVAKDVPLQDWNPQLVGELARIMPLMVELQATRAAAAVHGFRDAQGVGRRCEVGVSTDSVVQRRNGELVSCYWPSQPRLGCAYGMSEYEIMQHSSFVDFVDWAPQPLRPPRSLASPYEFLLEHGELGLSRDSRVAVLVHLFETPHRPWDAGLYRASPDDLLWWIGQPAGIWWEAVDDETLIIGRMGRFESVVWDARRDLVYSVR